MAMVLFKFYGFACQSHFWAAHPAIRAERVATNFPLRTTTTYLCQAPTTIVLPPSPPSCSPSPPSFTTTTTSTVLYTEAELTPNSTSYPPSPPSTGSTVLYSPNPTSYPPSLPSSTSSTTSLYPRPPSSPRDVNEISLHISLIDSQGSYVTAGRPVVASSV